MSRFRATSPSPRARAATPLVRVAICATALALGESGPRIADAAPTAEKPTVNDEAIFDEEDLALLREKGVSAPEFAVVELQSASEFESALLEDFHSSYEGYDRDRLYCFSHRQAKVLSIERARLPAQRLRAMLDKKAVLDAKALETGIVAAPIIREYWAWQKRAQLTRSAPPFEWDGIESRRDFEVIEIDSVDAFREVLLRDDGAYDGYDEAWLYVFSRRAAKEYKLSRDRLGPAGIKQLLWEKRQRDDAARTSPVARFPAVAEHREWLLLANPQSGALRR